jgi:hypothetical protein
MRLFQVDDVDGNEKFGDDVDASRSDSAFSIQAHGDDDESDERYGVERCFEP